MGGGGSVWVGVSVLAWYAVCTRRMYCAVCMHSVGNVGEDGIGKGLLRDVVGVVVGVVVVGKAST